MRKPKVKDYKLKFGALSARSATRRVVLHHSEGSGSAKDFHAWHRANGWSGIGYHFVVRKDGTVEQGRPVGSVGAHAAGANSDSIGICCEGNYSKAKSMPAAQRCGLAAIARWACEAYGVKKVVPHREVTDTDCPGANFPVAAARAAATDAARETCGYVVEATRYLYPSPKARKADRIAKLPKGTVLAFTGKTSGNWRSVKTVGANPKSGWVCRKMSGKVTLTSLHWPK